MFDWRDKATLLLPELSEEIATAHNPMALWVELNFAFFNAYDSPKNESLVRRIYAFADWCLSTKDEDLIAAVTCGLFEDIPRHPVAREEMPLWFTYEEVRDSRGIFGYMISPDDYEGLVEYMRQNMDMYLGRSVKV